MRTILTLFAGGALLGISACGNDNPNDIPRTVPPTLIDGAAAAPLSAQNIEAFAATISINAQNAARRY